MASNDPGANCKLFPEKLLQVPRGETRSASAGRELCRCSSSLENCFQPINTSSVETLNPRSIKKLTVDCHTGPKSSRLPRPIPLRCHRKSFRLLEPRVSRAQQMKAPPLRSLSRACSQRNRVRRVPSHGHCQFQSDSENPYSNRPSTHVRKFRY